VEYLFRDIMQRYPGDIFMIVTIRKVDPHDVAEDRGSLLSRVDMSDLRSSNGYYEIPDHFGLIRLQEAPYACVHDLTHSANNE
jgi:hypothetical protein